MSTAQVQAAIDAFTAVIEEELIALRQDLHRHPETAGEERRTAALVAGRLRAAGCAVSTGVGGHGVVAVLEGADARGPVVAYRADMDAVTTATGAAHLCGHDLHTAIGVGIAQVLTRLRDRWHGRVLLLFQPAEETLAGARAMIEGGALTSPAPGEIYALHCTPLPVGSFGTMPGYGLPGQDRIRIELSGPEAAAEAKRLAARIELLSTVQRPQDPREHARLLADLSTPDGPLARFVHAEAEVDAPACTGAGPGAGGAVVHARVRAWPGEQYADVREALRRYVASSPAGARLVYGGPPFPAMVCSPELGEAAAGHLRDALGEDAVTVLHAAFPFAGEDFALFLEQVPGAMCYLGVANPAEGLNGLTHTPDFGADERAIGIGVRGMAGLLVGRLRTGLPGGKLPRRGG